MLFFFFFFFQAEDGIRYFHVTGVQTCALPISAPAIADIAAEVEAGPIIDGIGEGAGCANGENGNRECQPLHGNVTKNRIARNRSRLSDSCANDVTRQQQPRGLGHSLEASWNTLATRNRRDAR